MMYSGTKEEAAKETLQLDKWNRCSGVSVVSDTFEGLMIKLASEFKKYFGDFSDEDCFLTAKEKKNHKEQLPLFFKPVKNSKIRCSTSVSNPKYINVSRAEINLRWQAWFLDTPFGRDNWRPKNKK